LGVRADQQLPGTDALVVTARALARNGGGPIVAVDVTVTQTP
jgi:hypothetical protein